MAPSQPMHFPAGLGINEAVQEQLLDPGSWNLRQENVRFGARGALYKRFGFAALTLARLDGTSRAAGNKVFTFGNQIGVIDGHTLDVWDPTLSVNVSRGAVPECGPVQRLTLPTNDTTTGVMDSAVVNGYVVCARAVFGTGSSNHILVSVINPATDAIVSSTTLSSVGTADAAGLMLVTAVGATAFIVFNTNSTTTIQCYRMDCSSTTTINAGWLGMTSLVTDANSDGAFDVTPFADRFALVYPNNSAGTNRLTVRMFNASAAQVDTTTVSTASVTPSCCACGGNTGDTLWIVWNQTATTRIIGLTPTNVTVTLATAANVKNTGNAPTQLAVTATTAAACSVSIVYSPAGSIFSINVQDVVTTTGASTLSGAVRAGVNVLMASRPWYVGGKLFAAVMPYGISGNGITQRNVVIVDLSAIPNGLLRPVATIAPRLATASFMAAPPHATLLSGSKYALMVFTQKTGAVGATAGQPTGYALEAVLLDFASSARWQAVDYNGNKYLTGGMLAYFDGNAVKEAAFLTRPSPPTTAFVGGGSITDVGIKYVAMWEAFDASGNVEWSAISDPSAAISPTAQNVTVAVESPGITCRDVSAIRVAIYRTTNNGNVYYRVGVVSQPFGGNTSSFTDSTPTATLIGNAQLYKSPGAVGTAQDRYCPPGFSSLVGYNGSLIGVGDDGSLWQSAQQVLGEGTWWNPVWQYPFTDDGTTTALATFDGTLFVFKRRAIYAIQGEPPDDTGVQGGLGTPRKLAVDVGCTDPRSILITAKGVFFQSDRGIELLDRSLSVEWIGEAIKNTAASYPVITSAVLDIFNSLALFTLATSESGGLVTGTGRTAVYDLARDKWVSTDRVTNFAGTADASAQSAAIVWSGSAFVYARLDTDGHVLLEDRTTYLDPNSVWITELVESCWLKLGLQMQQRLWELLMLASPNTDAQITMEFAHDWGAYGAVDVAKPWDDVISHGLTQFPARPRSQGQSLKVRVSDSAPATNARGTGQGFTLIGFSADIAPAQNDNAIKKTPHLAAAVRK